MQQQHYCTTTAEEFLAQYRPQLCAKPVVNSSSDPTQPLVLVLLGSAGRSLLARGRATADSHEIGPAGGKRYLRLLQAAAEHFLLSIHMTLRTVVE